MKIPVLYIVIPCYNEEEVLKSTAAAVKAKLSQLQSKGLVAKTSRIVLVNDGSKDKTWEIIKEINHDDPTFNGVKLSRNRGHQNALVAGLLYSKDRSDVTISMDADLQDDIDAIDQFVKAFHEGYDIVYGTRSSRTTDTRFKRWTARSFYKFMHKMGVDVVYDHADYRLISKRALEEFAKYSEVNLFLRGIIPLIGFPSTTVSYVRNERQAGESKYPLKKMISFALDGITSFSVKPIRFVFSIGIALSVISVLFLAYVLIQYLTGHTVEGWSFIACSLWFIGGVQMMSIGLIGEYIGKIYSETKARPRYAIEEIIE